MSTYKKHALLIFVYALIIFTIPSCDSSTDPEIPNYQLVWSDEFDGTAGQSPDSTKWTYDLGTGPAGDGWGNQELQYYTDRPQNVSLDGNGNLLITASNSPFGGSPFSSARIKTLGLLDQTYGRFEARIKMPSGPGIWPAFWMLGSNIDQIGWPGCGEIDIMEYRGQQPNLIHGSVHGPSYSAGLSVTKSYGFQNKRFDQDFYLFAVEWGADFIRFYVDNVMYQEITPEDVDGTWVFNTPFHIILNVAVGGTLVGFPTSETPFPTSMVIDYVRVYKEM